MCIFCIIKNVQIWYIEEKKYLKLSVELSIVFSTSCDTDK